LRAGEGMVPRLPLAAFLVLFEHREVDHPERAPRLFGKAALVPDLLAQRAQALIDDVRLVRAEHDEVPVLRLAALEDRGDGRVVQVLYDRRLQALAAAGALVHLDPRQALRPERLRVLAIGVDLASRQRSAA